MPARRVADRAARLDRRPRAHRRRRDHDLPRLADDRAVLLVRHGGERMAVRTLRAKSPCRCRPVAGRDLEDDVTRRPRSVRAVPGVAEVRPFTKEQSTKLLEPWLGRGLVARRLAGAAPDRGAARRPARIPNWPQLRRMFTEKVPGAVLDDHRGWIERMRAMAGTAVAGGHFPVAPGDRRDHAFRHLRDAWGDGDQRPVIEVLHFVGARNRYHRQAFPAAFPAFGSAGRRHRRRRRRFWCLRSPGLQPAGSPAAPAPNRRRRCSVVFDRVRRLLAVLAQSC